MNWDQVGTYFDRTIAMSRLESLDSAGEIGSLSRSTLLVVMEKDIVSKVSGEAIFRTLAAAHPLSICLFGEDANAAFNVLIAVLSRLPPDGHIMTKVCHGGTFQEGLDDFLTASWPSEGCHSSWTLYCIVVAGSEPVYLARLKQAREMLAA